MTTVTPHLSVWCSFVFVDLRGNLKVLFGTRFLIREVFMSSLIEVKRVGGKDRYVGWQPRIWCNICIHSAISHDVIFYSCIDLVNSVTLIMLNLTGYRNPYRKVVGIRGQIKSFPGGKSSVQINLDMKSSKRNYYPTRLQLLKKKNISSPRNYLAR